MLNLKTSPYVDRYISTAIGISDVGWSQMHILRGNTLKPGVAEDLASGVKKFLLLDDFLPVYVADFLVLRSVFSEKLRRSRIVAGESMSGQSAAGLVPAIVEAINLEDPLDIPDLWEQTQNAAISKASLQFRTALRVAFDAALESETLLTTVQLTRVGILLVLGIGSWAHREIHIATGVRDRATLV